MTLNSNYHFDQAEHIVKRLKKTELVGYIAREAIAAAEALESARKRAETLTEERDRLKLEVKRLENVRVAIDAVLALRAKTLPSPKQLTMLLQSGELDTVDAPELKDAASVLCEVIDGAETIASETYGSYAELEAAFDAAYGDREELLKRLGLTDYEWSVQGGNSFTDVEGT